MEQPCNVFWHRCRRRILRFLKHFKHLRLLKVKQPLGTLRVLSWQLLQLLLDRYLIIHFCLLFYYVVGSVVGDVQTTQPLLFLKDHFGWHFFETAKAQRRFFRDIAARILIHRQRRKTSRLLQSLFLFNRHRLYNLFLHTIIRLLLRLDTCIKPKHVFFIRLMP